jgi:CheY-like chemotaxis protein
MRSIAQQFGRNGNVPRRRELVRWDNLKKVTFASLGYDVTGRYKCTVGMDNPIVLVVEDEFFIRMNAVQMLEDAGYATLEASNADEAILLLETRADIRAVFTDINMSGSMDGLKLAHAIRRRWPPIHLIVTSGLQMLTEAELPPKGRFVGKPYNNAHVVAMFRELFAAA